MCQNVKSLLLHEYWLTFWYGASAPELVGTKEIGIDPEVLYTVIRKMEGNEYTDHSIPQTSPESDLCIH